MSEKDEGLQLSLFGRFEATVDDLEYAQSREDEVFLLKEDGALEQKTLAAKELPVFVHPRANRYIQLNQCCVGYELQYRRRRSLGLYVSEQGVSVNVPRWVGQREVEDFCMKKPIGF